MKHVPLVLLILGLMFISTRSEAQLTHIETLSLATPFLYGPCSDNAKLNDEKQMLFRWKPISASRKGYIFKLYRGYGQKKADLMIDEFLTGKKHRSYTVSGDKLEAGQTYTWILTEVFRSGHKSQKSACSFTISDR